MRLLSRLYDRFLGALAAASAAAFGLLCFIIAYEVTARWLGFRPPVWPVAISEYAMLYATVLGAPWLLRRAEHIQVTTLIAILPPRARTALARLVSFFAMAVCLLVAGYALRVTLSAQGLEIRSFEMPKWLLYAPLAPGFLLLAVEFGRHMFHATLFASDDIEYLSRRREA